MLVLARLGGEWINVFLMSSTCLFHSVRRMVKRIEMMAGLAVLVRVGSLAFVRWSQIGVPRTNEVVVLAVIVDLVKMMRVAMVLLGPNAVWRMQRPDT